MRKIYVTLFLSVMMTVSLMAQPLSAENELTVRQQSIARIAYCTGKGDLENLKPALAAGLDNGMTINEIREVLIHAYAYCGFPRSLRALQTFITVLDERKTQGIKDVAGKDASPVNDSRSRYERGRDILSEISGVPADAPKPAYAELTYAERELATVSVIAALGESVEPMLRSHMDICRNLGMTEEQLAEVLAIAASYSTNEENNNKISNVGYEVESRKRIDPIDGIVSPVLHFCDSSFYDS